MTEQSISRRPDKARKEHALPPAPSPAMREEFKLPSHQQDATVETVGASAPKPHAEVAVSEGVSTPGKMATEHRPSTAGRIPTSLPVPPAPAPPRCVQPRTAEPPSPGTQTKRGRRRRRRRPAAILRYYRAWTAAALLLAGGFLGVLSLLLVAYLMGMDPLGIQPQHATRPAGLRSTAGGERVKPAPSPEMPFGFTETEEEIDADKSAKPTAGDAESDAEAPAETAAADEVDMEANDEGDDASRDDGRSFRERLWELRKRRGRFRSRP